jgi:hypothetical protein
MHFALLVVKRLLSCGWKHTFMPNIGMNVQALTTIAPKSDNSIWA